MTRKQWNSGVVVALTMLLIAAMASQFNVAVAESAAPSAEALRAMRCATLHQVVPREGEQSLDLHIEALRSVLIANGEGNHTCRLLMMNSRIPAALAGTVALSSPVLRSYELVESGWGHESEARINLDLAPDTKVETFENEGVTHILLTNGSDAFTINLITTPYAELGNANAPAQLKSALMDVAALSDSNDRDAWWGEGSQQNLKNMLRAVRDAEFSATDYATPVVAAQEEVSQEDAPVAEEAPAVEEAEPVEEIVAPTPPAKREPQATKSLEANKEMTKKLLAATAPPLEDMPEGTKPEASVRKVWKGDPLRQPVTMDFRDAELDQVVPILASMAGINVVAGTDMANTKVTLSLKDVPLIQAMETALRLNGLGIVEEQGIYIIKPYLEAIAADRKTEVVDIANADAEEIAKTLQDVIAGSEFESLISITSNKTASTVIVTGPEDHIGTVVRMATRLDVEQMILPTVTMPIKLNYADPADMLTVVQGILTKEVGQATIDERARILVITDIPIIVEQITSLIKQLDIPAKSVAIEGLIVDVTLTDAADTGVDWLISAVQSQSRRDAAGNTGIFTGDLQDLSLNSNLSIGDAAGLLNFGILSGDVDWRGVIQAEVRNNNSTLLSNPKLITVENQPATILIASEIPYVELTSTEQGGQQTSTEFKPIGTELTVTPTVTHDNHIIAKILAKESTSTQEVNGVPVEDKRQIETTPHIKSGQTIYVGGLRKNNDTVTVRKVPLLGDVPVMNFLFRSNQRNETVNELLIFLTCTVLDEDAPLTAYQLERADEVRNARVDVSAETRLIHDTVHPNQMRDPAWKWRKHNNE